MHLQSDLAKLFEQLQPDSLGAKPIEIVIFIVINCGMKKLEVSPHESSGWF